MSTYVDGFVLPLPKDKIPAYRRLARIASKVWLEHGALAYHECVGDDLEVKDMIPFPTLAQIKPDETVVFSWIVFKSRRHRDTVNAKVMKDPRLTSIDPATVPFDCKRIAYGGFKTLVSA